MHNRPPAHWQPEPWEEKGYTVYERLDLAARRLGAEHAAALAQLAIEIVDMAIAEKEIKHNARVKRTKATV